ncbi:DUF4023 family protein [Virgibacillus sp. L01]
MYTFLTAKKKDKQNKKQQGQGDPADKLPNKRN